MIPKICALCVICALVGFLLSEMGFKGKKAFVLLSITLILSSTVGQIGEIFTDTVKFFGNFGVGETAKSASKIVGLGYVFGISTDICDELGETRISKALVLCARVEILGLTIPYVKNILELGIDLIK